MKSKSSAWWPSLLYCGVAGLWFVASASASPTAFLVSDSNLAAPARYGLDELAAALKQHGWSLRYGAKPDAAQRDLLIFAGLSHVEGVAGRLAVAGGLPLPEGPESLGVRKTVWHGTPALLLCASDTRGLMYAALDVADRIGWSKKAEDPLEFVTDVTESPDLLERSISMYTMQRAYFESRLFDEQYWERYFDLLARCRFNSFVVIFGYENGGFMAPPYPYFFDVEGFPDVRLVGITAEQQQRNIEAFRRLIQCAHRHGIDFIPGIWDHIYRGGVQGGGIKGANKTPRQPVPGLVWGVTAGNLAPYNKAAIARFLEVFPNIDGIQFRMHGESGLKRDEIPVFWHEIFQIIKEKRPELRVDIRAKGLPDQVIDDGLKQGVRIRVATKYWMEQMGLPFHPTHINPPNQHDRRHGYADLLTYPQRYKVHWRMWTGGTTRVLLWGDPDYARRFARSAHLYGGNSFEVNEPLATKMLAQPHDEPPFQLLNAKYRYYDWEFERYWHFFQVFGRLGYNPHTPDDVWQREFQQRFGEQVGPKLMHGLHLASRVLPRIVAASYRYRYFPTTRGWAEKMRIDDLPTYATAEGSDVQQFANFKEAATLIVQGHDTAKRRPAETSRWFAHTSEQILKLVAQAEAHAGSNPNKEFLSTVTDLKILAFLALYHSHRMLAAVHYNLFQDTQDLWALDDAIRQEKLATHAWRKLVAAADDVYTSNLAMGIAHGGLAGHWRDELVLLQEGIKRLDQQRSEFRPRLEDDRIRIAHVPMRRTLPGKSVMLRASVFARSKLRHVRCSVVSASERTVYPMAPHGQWQYSVAVPLPSPGQKVSYTIEVYDVQGRRSVFPVADSTTAIDLRVSDDRSPPTVDLDRVTTGVPGQPIHIAAHASDPSGVKSLRLRYRHVTQFEDYRTAEMDLNPETGRYEAEIPGDFVVPRWDVMYFVEALDRQGNGRMFPDLEVEMPYVIVQLERGPLSPGRK